MELRHYPGEFQIEPILRHLSWDLDDSNLRAETIGERAVFICKGRFRSDCCLCLLFKPMEGGLQVSMERSEAKWFNLLCAALGGMAALALESLFRRETRLGQMGLVSALSLARQIPLTVQSILLERRVWRSIDQAVSFQARLHAQRSTCRYCGAGQSRDGNWCPHCGAPRGVARSTN